MTNKEIDARLKGLAKQIPDWEEHLRNVMGSPKVERELEIMNMSLMAIWTMLGEIAKRLPEPQGGTDGSGEVRQAHESDIFGQRQRGSLSPPEG